MRKGSIEAVTQSLTATFSLLFLLGIFLIIGSTSFASQVIESSDEHAPEALVMITEESFTPIDSTPDNSLFYLPFVSTKSAWLNPHLQKKILPPVSADFYKIANSSIAIGGTPITWGDIAIFLTSICVVGGEKAQDFLVKISEEIVPSISHQADGTYVALDKEANQPAQFALSSDIFSRYATWRANHYQIYKTLCAEKESSYRNTKLLEKQIEELGAVDDSVMDTSTVAYRLATQEEWNSWLAHEHELMEPPAPGKSYGLLLVNTKKVEDFTAYERREQPSSSNTSVSNDDASSALTKDDLPKSPSGKEIRSSIQTFAAKIASCIAPFIIGIAIGLKDVFLLQNAMGFAYMDIGIDLTTVLTGTSISISGASLSLDSAGIDLLLAGIRFLMSMITLVPLFF